MELRFLMENTNQLVFDTGPLRHFAAQGWLRALEFLAGDRPIVVPESVERELRHQAHELPALNQVLDAPWITVDRSDDIAFLARFATYEERLAVGETNLGECGVLALGAVGASKWFWMTASPETWRLKTASECRQRWHCSAPRSEMAS